jgi:hypothetical protein
VLAATKVLGLLGSLRWTRKPARVIMVIGVIRIIRVIGGIRIIRVIGVIMIIRVTTVD